MRKQVSVLIILSALGIYTSLAETQSNLKPRVIFRSTVFRHPTSDPYDRTNLYGFNHAPSIVRLPNGHLLVAWFSGPFEASVHQLILGSYSSDEGRTWGSATVLNDFARKSDFDPAFISDGEQTLFFFSAGRWIRWPFVKNEKMEVGPESYKTYCRASGDSGRTWSDPMSIAQAQFCRSNGIKLSTGELLLPIYDHPGNTAGVLKSSNSGKTWHRFGKVTTTEGADEPSIAESKSGAVLMILRTRDGFLWKAHSKDKGETWGPAEKTDMSAGATSHNLFRTTGGSIVLTHNPSKPPARTPLTLRVSHDDGASWGEPVVLAEVPIPGPNDTVWSHQVSYPSVVELSDGTLVVVWAEIVLSDTDQHGDIYAARVRLW